ncbi:MAG: hypothetical protein IPM82_00425 [Saprospiraceae bacterium]|nr:hypothetical protein [Saprospiraceae bacterium]
MRITNLVNKSVYNKTTNYLAHIVMVLAIMTIALSSCNKDSDKTNLVGCNEHTIAACSQEIGKTNLRIKNNSNYDFCNVVINPFSGNVNCGSILRGETTCYRAFDIAYHYGYVHLSIDGREYSLIPTDYVGETPLGAGNFTYLIDVPDISAESVSITVIVD